MSNQNWSMGLSQTRAQTEVNNMSDSSGVSYVYTPGRRRTRASSINRTAKKVVRSTRVSMGSVVKKTTPIRARRKSETEVTFKKRACDDSNYMTLCSEMIRHSKRTIRNMARSGNEELPEMEERNMIKKIATLTEELHKNEEELHKNEEEICSLYDCLQKTEEDSEKAKMEMTEKIQAQNEEIENLHREMCKSRGLSVRLRRGSFSLCETYIASSSQIPQCFISNGQELEPLQTTKSLSRGKGSFASCVPFIYRGTQVCVKSFFTGRVGTTPEEAEENMLHEASILLKLKDNAGIPKLLLVIMESANKQISSTSLVLSYHGMDGQSTTLQRILDNPRVYELSEDIWFNIANAMCDVLESIHDSGIIHADLKSENVIVDNNYQPVIVDYGRSCLDSSPRYEPTILDPQKYDWIAPEVCLRASPHSYESDIYSLGTLFLDIINQGRVNSNKLSTAAHLCHHRAEFRPKIVKVKSIINKNTKSRLMCQLRRCRLSTI
ncbi:probable serine/threonine-protein kinase DDB_G0271682 [Anneissia japonica]|uniref:probable serine/threonine-protein kinase DDB_G0271682 n=1 Tax=Anneissia japonica TaxID=1529436 RepID=UPI00142550AC|nr:probable serine/threonine-protein kinase DDB_G0271682 [Anneissia japonica]XP_033106504.1 probable serine/threonine-protein kinase DDB_G0271682 [Anneissia japonica]XP_033106505.1 probable serine/threonine-protein kinase DDB_G0271682 [Anneissia japonica]XP_033106506.1 probable serine/threonine-protein kinase DDB_G0271682 [Anneissia japonica]